MGFSRGQGSVQGRSRNRDRRPRAMARILQHGGAWRVRRATDLSHEAAPWGPRRRRAMPNTNQPFERAMTLAALSGLKIALGPAFLLSARNRPGNRNWVIGAM